MEVLEEFSSISSLVTLEVSDGFVETNTSVTSISPSKPTRSFVFFSNQLQAAGLLPVGFSLFIFLKFFSPCISAHLFFFLLWFSFSFARLRLFNCSLTSLAWHLAAFFCFIFGFQLTLYSFLTLFDWFFLAFFCVLVRTIDIPCQNLRNSPLKMFPC